MTKVIDSYTFWRTLDDLISFLPKYYTLSILLQALCEVLILCLFLFIPNLHVCLKTWKKLKLVSYDDGCGFKYYGKYFSLFWEFLLFRVSGGQTNAKIVSVMRWCVFYSAKMFVTLGFQQKHWETQMFIFRHFLTNIWKLMKIQNTLSSNAQMAI